MGSGCEGVASDISSRLLKVNIEKGTVPRIPHLVQHLTFPTHGRFLFPWPEGLEGSSIPKKQRPPYLPSICTNRLPLFCSIVFYSYLGPIPEAL